MDALNNSSDPKTQLMNQVRQEAAMINARQLIEVGSLPEPEQTITPIPPQYQTIAYPICRK